MYGTVKNLFPAKNGMASREALKRNEAMKKILALASLMALTGCEDFKHNRKEQPETEPDINAQ